MRRWPVMGATFAVLWLFVRGVALEPLAVAGELLVGLVFGMAVAFAFRRFYRPAFALSRVAALPYVAVYLGLFFKDLLVANVDVAYRVLAPSMPIEPDVVEVPLRVETDMAITTIANSITLTPGTLTMDYDAETNTLYVHGITGEYRGAVVDPVRVWEDYALRIFDEEADPTDPAPTPAERKAAVATETVPDGEGRDATGVDEAEGGVPDGE